MTTPRSGTDPAAPSAAGPAGPSGAEEAGPPGTQEAGRPGAEETRPPGSEDVWVEDDGTEVIRLRRWRDPWPDDDPHANFKAEVQLYGRLDPLVTIRGMARNLDIPMGAIARYVLARWATGGSGGLLELGPVMVPRLWEPIAAAEAADSDEQRLAAYHQLRQMISWLKVPLDDPSVYP